MESIKNKSSCLEEIESRYSKLLFNRRDELLKLSKSELLDEYNEKEGKPAAWNDEDDEVYSAGQILQNGNPDKYIKELKRKYKNVLGTPQWAKLSKKLKTGSSDSEDDDDALRTVGHLDVKHKSSLKSNLIELKRYPQINKDGNEGPIIKVIEFHPTSSVAIVAGNSTMSIYSIGGDQNEKLHSVAIPDFKFLAARFLPNNNQAIIVGSNTTNYYIYDLIKAQLNKFELPRHMNSPKIFDMSPCGEFAAVSEGFTEVCLINMNSNELLYKFNQSSNVKSLAFSSDSTKLYSFSENGLVYVYGMKEKKMINKFSDNGCITGSVITESPCGNYLATGSCEGIVNLYKTSSLNAVEPVPFKTISNLTTRISALKFNFSSELLGYSSAYLPNAMKLFHMQSQTTFKNFPEAASKFHQIQTFNFSPNGGFLGIVNNKHKAYLYRLKHYYNY